MVYSSLKGAFGADQIKLEIEDTREEVINIYFSPCDYDAPAITRIKILFRYIYKVRCNLFHGKKIPTNERDLELVTNSAKILEWCLPGLIEQVYRKKID